ncbi:HIRA-interacting protein 3 [Sorex fumeus]|uniref:HIRA-interacting protein 3 n=1 Tax=Sorex fumeus TaxID=62283 RepID=UPI0024AD0501|nr:HIRA-interacting protein 3 [Sorex fumeus]
MAREEMLAFTRDLFRGRPDLSTLTHSIVRRRFLAHAGRDHLEPQEKQTLKRLVEEELLNMQGDEANAREETPRDLARRTKRLPSPCSDPARKRSRFSSESEPSSGASSPDSVDPLAKNRLATGIGATAERPRRASKKPVESSDEEQQEDVTAKTGSEEGMKSREEEGGSVRTSKALKAEGREGTEDEKEDESSEGKEGEEGKREPKGRTRKQLGMNNKRVRGKPSARRKQAKVVSEDSETGSEKDVKESSEEEEEGGSVRTSKVSEAEGSEGKEEEEEEREPKGRTRKQPGKNKMMSARRKQAKEVSEDSGEEEPIQRTGQKMRKTATKNHESEEDHEGEENLVVEENQEEEDQKSRFQSNGRKRAACEQKSRGGARLLGSKDNREGQDDSGSEADSSGEEENSSKKAESTDTGMPAKVSRLNGDVSDSEREESDSGAEGSPKGERKNRSSKKNSKKGRTRNSSSSSSDGSPETKFRKAGSGRHGEDDPAVMRLKRYIRACGAYRNYKKLLGSCHSSKERLRILRAELEALGMKGNPSLEKCRALKERREEAAEVASLDVSNIINCPGRPRRRTAWNPSAAAPPGELYRRRALDSEDEQPRPPRPDWSHMRGIISSDGESN